ncbi:lysine N(6)-hydroxylase/L-ornithine N(5)-oxygenase family protein [Bacteriovorax sp. Seq25_V]|uniref:lysine N(6)-hydroxylase/L-ornithine N(5)-oxygenase family protein n=1 Tax=Bacteriovorax sp. Seq25_V TaxID=1201288 RepID=UPI000389E90A|nr:SidA/IucD/PvdA family monooxygenase [Bacteriovorax sp. Seq25_V]EQC47404.1 putative L-lysine 6-monooxygenase [Bacteriovorax sp. Seq25_V]
MSNTLDLIGIGIGPFNLSLASLLSKTNLSSKFFDLQKEFTWHKELHFNDAIMQTSYLKDLVTPVDPTNPQSFLNYLVEKGIFYQFMNTGRKSITRIEFQDYCQWVSRNLADRLLFDTSVENVTFKDGNFHLATSNGEYVAKNICIGTGPVPRIPNFATSHIGKNVFHAKSKNLKDVDFTAKRVLIVGGGQTGLEIFRNGLQENWGRADKISIISDRQTFQPLDEASFSNDFFTPDFINSFFDVKSEIKEEIVNNQKFMSDGNTPVYLDDFYNELYLDRFYLKKFTRYEILPMRWVTAMTETPKGDFNVTARNTMHDQDEVASYDIVILATGFETRIPNCLESLFSNIHFDNNNRPVLEKDYSLRANLPTENRIFAMNFSRHCHGIADPQTSLMAWRSATVINTLTKKTTYQTSNYENIFCDYSLKGENNA